MVRFVNGLVTDVVLYLDFPYHVFYYIKSHSFKDNKK